MSTAPDIGAADQELYDREVPAARDLISRFRIAPGIDACGLPIALKLTEGQAHDGRSAVDMLDSISEGQILFADRAYDSDALRDSLAERGAWANVKPMSGRKHKPAFSPFLYRYRNLVERFFKKLKHFRAVATRYDRDPASYLAAVKLASARLWLRANESTS